MTTKELIVIALGHANIETHTIYEFMIRFDYGKVGVCRFVKYGQFGHHRQNKEKDLVLNIIRHAGASLGCAEFEGYIKADTISDFYDKALMIANSALHQYELKTYKESKRFVDALSAIELMKG